MRLKYVDNSIRGGNHLTTLFRFIRFEGIEFKSRKRGQYSALSLGLKNELSCITKEAEQHLDMFQKCACADLRSLLQRCFFLEMVGLKHDQ